MPNPETSKPAITVLTCTHNPRPDIFSKVLEGLARQTLPTSQWEYLLVDNASEPAIELEALNARLGLPMRIIREPTPGLVVARRRGIRESAGEILVMVDDDNILDRDYLESALAIAQAQPDLGAFGGVARAHPENSLERKWYRRLSGYLGIRDYGETVITSNEDRWGEWEPIGAGMVLRKDVAEKFIELMDNAPLAARLGHNGKQLLAGDDSLMARAAYRLGYSCSYQPRLKVTHFIKSSRIKLSYLTRLLFGQGRSTIILNSVLGIPSPRLGIRELIGRFRHRRAQDGVAGAIIWAWDLGYFVESRRQKRQI